MEPAEADENIITRFGWYINFLKEGYTMSKKEEALAKFVEVVKKLSPEEFEDKYVKEKSTFQMDKVRIDEFGLTVENKEGSEGK